MSREIKFRIYVPQDKGFVYFGLQDYPQGIYGAISEPMQFTGEKDKNGNEIYEGDILHYYSNEYINDNVTGYVLFDQGSFLLKVSNSDIRLCIGDENTQIMGNIHENLNLLN